MSRINIEIFRVEVENKGKYQIATVSYKGPDGKADSKKVVSFAVPETFKVLKDAQPGDLFEIVSEKDTNGYWQWNSAVSVGKNVGGSTNGSLQTVSKNSPRSTYETPEERAARQIYIVRQSSIANAIEFLKANNPKGAFVTDDVLEVAGRFEAHVFAFEPVPEPEVI